MYGCGKSASSPEKIIGQVQAIDRMVDEDMPCEDVLAQINAAKSALNGCGKVVLEGHIRHCVRDGIEHGDPDKTIESLRQHRTIASAFTGVIFSRLGPIRSKNSRFSFGLLQRSAA